MVGGEIRLCLCLEGELDMRRFSVLEPADSCWYLAFLYSLPFPKTLPTLIECLEEHSEVGQR